jgi:hypothetical protein
VLFCEKLIRSYFQDRLKDDAQLTTIKDSNLGKNADGDQEEVNEIIMKIELRKF